MAEGKNPLELVVTKNVVGALETNIEQLEVYVTSKLEEYKPELYKGDAVSAKKDRAELNNSKKFLANTRINLMRELMKPYSDFETRCKNLEKQIDMASNALDEIVKVKENEEKEAKRENINALWKMKNFHLVPLDNIFNPKWLNKSTKESDISQEMDAIIERIYKDLKTIEKFEEDAETIKAHYLICLDIGDSLDYGEELRKKRKLAEEEAKTRAEREHTAKIEQQQKEVAKEVIAVIKKEQSVTSGLASEALGIEPAETKKVEIKEYVVSIKATEEQLMRLKSACNALSIEYSVEELTF